MMARSGYALVAFTACIGAMGLLLLRRPEPQRDRTLAAFTTSLARRTASQRHNAILAARALDGAKVPPGGTFSYNRCVGNWTAEAGYRKAPVSNEGVLVRAVGGGVCQVSTALYNAALLADLPIVERHPHAVAPTYVPPGRDAAVAFDTLDLRFRNPGPHPIAIRCRITRDYLTVALMGKHPPKVAVGIVTRIVEREAPRRIVVVEPQSPLVRHTSQPQSAAHAGWRVVTYRTHTVRGREIARERISDDRYRAVHRVWFASDTSDRTD